MYWVVLFIIGVAVGSFINVLATRYREGGRIFSRDILSGRSHCDFCGQTLAWYELIPLVSFMIQAGRCRHCQGRLSWQYPVVELLCGLFFAVIPMYATPIWLWLPAFSAILLLSLIDMRLLIIPDQISWFLVILGAANIALGSSWALLNDSLLGAAMGGAMLGTIFLFSSGEGIGFGDVKLAAVLGFLFGLKSVVLIIALAFVIGSLVALPLLIGRKKSMTDGLPFGQFLGLASVIVLFFGQYIIERYLIYVQF